MPRLPEWLNPANITALLRSERAAKKEQPQTSTVHFYAVTGDNRLWYAWKGQLHPTQDEIDTGDQGPNASNACSTPDILGVNFAQNYQSRPNLDLIGTNIPSYALDFSPPQNPFEKRQGWEVRGMNSTEQDQFMTAFQQANQQATSQRT